MIYRAFLLGLSLLPLTIAEASQWQSHDQIKQLVHHHVWGQLQSERGHSLSADRLNISVANLDSRLRLADCTDAMDVSITSPAPYASQVTTKVTCRGSSAWAIYLPVRIDLYAEVAVASRNLARGDVVTQADIELRLMNTAQAGHGFSEDANRLLGMTLKRSLQAGDTVRLSHLEASKVVARGEKVVVEARGNGISVVAEGTALAAGVMGERIRVRNSQSNRVVDAKVIGPGRVEVAL